MGRHKRFADIAGFTRHCWECDHAAGWDGERGWCSVHTMIVSKTDSPNNCCSRAGRCYSYREIGEVKR